jgi:DNA (cytosine-5)-methyltransferase 1
MTAVFSFFAGAGFLDLGFETSGFSMQFVNEIYGPFLEAYRHGRILLGVPKPHFGYFGDDIVSFLETEKMKDLSFMIRESRREHSFIGFVGGPPCPDFSQGGKNRGRHGDNGRLTGTYFELICQQKPDFFLFENVKGLWRTRRHRAFYEDLKQDLSSSGYVLAERLINAIEYGVPQDRQRIILVGFKKNLLWDAGIKVEGMLSEEIFSWEKYLVHSADEVFSLPWPTLEPFVEDSITQCPDGLLEELTVEYWFRQNDVNNHPNSIHFFVPRGGLPKMQVIDEGDVSRKSYKRLHRWRYSPTACYGNNEVHLHPYKVRRITVAEALALQSLPVEYSLPDSMSLTDMFKTVGNGVPYLAAKSLATSIVDFLKKIQR